MSLKRSKSVIAALRFLESNFFAQADFSHAASVSCSYDFVALKVDKSNKHGKKFTYLIGSDI